MTDKKPFFIAIHSDHSMFTIDMLKIAPGKKVTIEKSDQTTEVLEIADFNTSFIDNPMTGSKELVINVSFVKHDKV